MFAYSDASQSGILGAAGCLAIEALCQVSAIKTLLSSFIKVRLAVSHLACTLQLTIDYPSVPPLQPLQEQVDSRSRIHGSLNLNTETGVRSTCQHLDLTNIGFPTGRLSSRRPNLQNQPALEKDIYKV